GTSRPTAVDEILLNTSDLGDVEMGRDQSPVRQDQLNQPVRVVGKCRPEIIEFHGFFLLCGPDLVLFYCREGASHFVTLHASGQSVPSARNDFRSLPSDTSLVQASLERIDPQRGRTSPFLPGVTTGYRDRTTSEA